MAWLWRHTLRQFSVPGNSNISFLFFVKNGGRRQQRTKIFHAVFYGTMLPWGGTREGKKFRKQKKFRKINLLGFQVFLYYQEHMFTLSVRAIASPLRFSLSRWNSLFFVQFYGVRPYGLKISWRLTRHQLTCRLSLQLWPHQSAQMLLSSPYSKTQSGITS